MKVLVTGSAGFIGSEVCIKLLERGDIVVGVDNHNNYYDPKLKEARLARHIDHSNYIHSRIDISDKEALDKAFKEHKPERVINLAAQAGVRYSIENPHSYIQSNIMGFMNILECCRHYAIEHLVYASSSSVYGANSSMPFSVQDNVDHPISLYAASKKSNELMAHTYSHLYELPSTGLRFFTVYGPWGRPDMALFKFTSAILAGEKIQVYNHGKHRRDFTYITDIVEGVIRVVDNPPKSNQKLDGSKFNPGSSSAPWRIYNIGNNKPVELMNFIKELENNLGINAKMDFLPMQPGDVLETFADIDDLVKNFDYKPQIDFKTGIRNFVQWYKIYFSC
jgi:UDP-glucuronate 4-epimerase